MEEYRRYLSDKLLSDEEPITYRALSRALDVHVNTAKEMLYDFHQYQNGVKAHSVYATYLLFGRKKAVDHDHNGDIEMSSSPPDDNIPSDEVITDTLTMVGEDKLEKILAEYEEVTSIHVHTLSPQPKIDYAQLVNLCDAIPRDREADPMEQAQRYGYISNANVRRRERRMGYGAKPLSSAKAPASSSAAKAVAAPKPVVKAEPAEPVKPAVNAGAATKDVVKSEEPLKEESKKAEAMPKATGTSKKATSVPTLKRGGSSIMGAFANAKPPKSKPGPAKKEEEDAMALSDDGEADEEELGAATKSKPSKEEALSFREKKKAREEELRQMMEEDDEEKEEKEESEDEKMDDAPEPEPEPMVEEKKDEGPSEVVASSGDGRKRGKRRVMKKKRVLDDDGYMVTMEEAAWESFSEEDAPPPAKKQATGAPAAAKAPRKPAAKGQGSIMSFFGKK